MPRLPTDYSRTIMYKIVCNDLRIEDCYVGHTTDFTSRKSVHKSSCNTISSKNYNAKVYQFIRENGGWNNFSMIQIEEYPCSTSNEASARERYWYETLCATLNNNVPNRSHKEYGEIYRQKEKYKENYRNWYENNKEKVKETQAIYNQTHKEKFKEYHKKYKETHKEEIRTQKSSRIKCECGSNIRVDNINRHLNTDKHKIFILSKKESESESEII